MAQDQFYESYLRPLLFSIGPEDAHNLIHLCLKMFGSVLPSLPYRYEGTDLQVELAGQTLANPIGLAAGFDKNAHLVGLLGDLGFGFAEIGSVTARATQGNPKPRLFRLSEDRALINRMGLNGEGAASISQRLANSRWSLPVGINIAKTHDPLIAGDAAVEDILVSFNSIKGMKATYVALNASCPNTREGCLQEKALLHKMLSEMQRANTSNLPLFIKVSPDSSDELLHDILEIGHSLRLAGYVCGNTTTSRDGLRTGSSQVSEIGNGGLSGPPLKPKALEVCRKIARQKGENQQIIAVGGIETGDDAYTFIKSGATAIEVYTALVYRGPSTAKQICQELSTLLQRDGLTLKAAIGAGLQ